MSVGRFSVRQKVLAQMLSFFILVAGLYNLRTIRKEVLPPIEVDTVTVRTVYPGASAEDIERIITSPIEDAIEGIRGIERVRSTSFEGLSLVIVELKPDLPDPVRVYNDIKSAVDRVRDLPEDATAPEVVKLEIEIPVVQVALSSAELSERELRAQARLLEQKIRAVPGVSSVVKVGWRPRQIWIETDPALLRSYDVAVSQILNAVRARNVSVPAGRVPNGESELLLKTTGEIREVGEVARIVLRANDQGHATRVGDVARVSDMFGEETVVNRVGGERAISLVVQKRQDKDALEIQRRLVRVVEGFRRTAPAGLTVRYANDVTPRIRRRLTTLTGNLLMGFAIVFGVLLLFLTPSAAWLTALAIPFSFLTSLVVMGVVGTSINMISLFGLILVLGMIVDQGIVVSENAFRHREAGMGAEEAVVKGVDEVVMPVLASVLTTMAAFFPMLLIRGLTGKFVRDIPLTVIIALAASMLQAFVVMPSSLRDALERPEAGEAKGLRRFLSYGLDVSRSRWFQGFLAGYERVLRLFLRRRGLVLAAAVAVFVLSIVFAATVMRFELFSSRGVDRFSVVMETRENATLAFTERQAALVERVVLGLPSEEVVSVVTRVGTDSAFGFGGDNDSNLAVIDVELTDESRRKRTADEIIADLTERLKGVGEFRSVRFVKGRQGPARGKPVNVELRGDDYDVLAAAAVEVAEVVGGLEGVHSVESSFRRGKEELRVRVDDRRAAQAGITVAQAGMVLRTAYEGMKAGSVRWDGEVVDLVVKYDRRAVKSLRNLREVRIPNMMGQLVPLGAVASFETVRSLKRADHIDGRRVVTVSAEIDAARTTSRRANMEARRALKDLPRRYPGLQVRFTGEAEDTRESVEGLAVAFVLALLLIYLILAVSFQSFVQPVVVMVTIPFGIVGIILALAAHGMPLSFFGLMGIVALAGVIVNNGILILEFITRHREELGCGGDVAEAVVAGTRLRFRPILLTAGTTALGLLPTAYGIGGGDVMIQPLAVAFMWGLIFGTVLTLLLMPVVYVVFEDLGRGVGRLLGIRREPC